MLKLKAKLDLDKIVYLPNIVDELDHDDLVKIAADVRETYKRDKDSRMQWEHDTKLVIELSKLIAISKDTPYPGCSNVKYPLISTAATQSAANMYPEIIRNGRVVELAALGLDQDGSKQKRASRVGDFMNYQLLVESAAWERDLDKRLTTLPLIGTAFVKTYYDPIGQKNISELCPYDEIFINANAKDIDDGSRYPITHVIPMNRNTLIEKMRYGHYTEVDLDKMHNNPLKEYDDDEMHYILEQHRYLDLDGDGYAEPYIVTVLDTNEEVLRIIARFDPDGVERNHKDQVQCIHPIQYFTDFHHIPNPDGSFYSLGIGHLLYGSNEIINTILNLQVDAGRFANLQTGIMDQGIRLKGGELSVNPGFIQKVDSAMMGALKDHIHMWDFKEPSPVLLQLFQIILSGAKELASITDVNTGQAQVQNVATQVMATQQSEGSKLKTGIQRRFTASLKKEFEKLFRLNRIFLDPQKYQDVLDDPLAISQSDFESKSFDIRPVADSATSSDEQRQRQMQAMLQLMQVPQLGQHINAQNYVQRAMDILRIPNQDQLLVQDQPNKPTPEEMQMQADLQAAQQRQQIDAEMLELKKQELIIKSHMTDAEIVDAHAAAQLKLAQAAEIGGSTQNAQQMHQIQAQKAAVELVNKKHTADQQHQLAVQKAAVDATNTQQDMKHRHELELAKTAAQMQQDHHLSLIQTAHKGQIDLQKERIKADAKPKTPKGE